MREDEMRELEGEIGRVLRELPVPKAPPTLLARVMREVQAVPALPWYRAGWFFWPMGWRVASVALMGALIVGGVLGIPYLAESTGTSSGRIEGELMDFFAPAFGLAAFLRVGVVTLGAMVRAVPPDAVGLVGVGVILMMTVTIVAGAALRRLSPDWEMFS